MGWLSSDELGVTSDEFGKRSELKTRNSKLVTRMMALSVAYQQERQNVEAGDLTAVVIRAIGLLLGKSINDELARGVSGVSGVTKKEFHVLTKTITGAADVLINEFELDINTDLVTSRRIGRALKKMRIEQYKQPVSGLRGWKISLDDLTRWARAYGLNPARITGLDESLFSTNATNAINATNATIVKGIL